MAKELVSVYAFETVGQCIEEIRRQGRQMGRDVCRVYVVDNNENSLACSRSKTHRFRIPLPALRKFVNPMYSR